MLCLLNLRENDTTEEYDNMSEVILTRKDTQQSKQITDKNAHKT